MVWWLAWSTVNRQVGVRLVPEIWTIFDFPVAHAWVIKGFGMSSRVYAAGHAYQAIIIIIMTYVY